MIEINVKTKKKKGNGAQANLSRFESIILGPGVLMLILKYSTLDIRKNI